MLIPVSTKNDIKPHQIAAVSKTMPSDTDHHGQQNSPSQDEISADALLNKCRTLLKELDKFEAACLAVRGHGTTSDIRPLRNAVASELKSLERVC